jgi:hypothetical protein
MSELNFKPATAAGHTGARTMAATTRNPRAQSLPGARSSAALRQRRRRLHAARLPLETTGFRLFRVY